MDILKHRSEIKRKVAIGALFVSALLGLTACWDHNSQILAPTVAAAEAQGLRTNFVPHGEFTQEMFNQVARNIFIQGVYRSRPCTISLIDFGDDPNSAYFLTADHCVGMLEEGDRVDFVNPWKNEVLSTRGIQKARNPVYDLAVFKWPNLNTNGDGWIINTWYGARIPLASKPLHVGQEVLIAGYPAVADIPGIVGGKNKNLIPPFGYADSILMVSFGKIFFISTDNSGSLIAVETSNFQSTAPGHSGSIMFVVEEGKLKAAGVLSGAPPTDDHGNTVIRAYGTQPIKEMINSMTSVSP